MFKRAIPKLVSHGVADVGLGSETGLMSVTGIDFIPLQTESYDLIMRQSDADKQPYQNIMEILASDEFKMDLQTLSCYDTEETGKIKKSSDLEQLKRERLVANVIKLR